MLKRLEHWKPMIINLNGVDRVITNSSLKRDSFWDKSDEFVGEIEWENSSDEFRNLIKLKNPFHV